MAFIRSPCVYKAGNSTVYTLFKKAVYVHLKYMKKILDCDWLREMQFFGNTAQKKGNLVQERITNVIF